MLYRDVLVDVLAEECGINEHVSHCYEWNEITQHVTSMVSDEVLDQRKYAATDNHHHEDT